MASAGEATKLAEAIASEAIIADEAAKLREGAGELTAELFMALYPLLCKPIPSAFIESISATKGKPYESTGVRSVQVQIDRMNNVLTPLWWWDEAEYEDGGKLAKVTVFVGNPGAPMLHRSSRGGVSQGTGAGNIYKGSYTNAAKVAFARVGVGHEVYLGAADLDPDVNAEVANEPTKTAEKQPVSEIGPGIAQKLVDRVWSVANAKASFQLAASHAAGGRDVGDCSTKDKAKEAIVGLDYAQAEKLDRWVTKKETEAEVEASTSKEDRDE
jgi:hypothetical protein